MKIGSWYLMVVLITILSACSIGAKDTGSLQGHVTIGPLVPVVGPGMEIPTPGPEVYAARKVVIFNANGKRELQKVDIQGDGTYRVELVVGTYTVDINHLGIDHASGLPAIVEIRAGQVTLLDIDIDTGIR
jgi:hypothetical protein